MSASAISHRPPARPLPSPEHDPLTGHGGRPAADPPVPDWASLELPDAWPDQLDLRRPRQLLTLLRGIAGRGRRVQLPERLPGRELLPKYLLQEFHNLPNGNYSRRISRGYLTGFDRVMLGHMRGARARLADFLRGCDSAIDIGCGGGRTAAALREAGVREVWGLDPSPYLLQHAAHDFPTVRFVQGLAEQTGFPERRFDGIAACFLLHELPPRQTGHALAEFARILRPGGRLAICEPSPLQMRRPGWQLWRREVWRAHYFHRLARLVHEPFIDAWHRCDARALLAAHGFELVGEEQQLPLAFLFARKR